MPQDLRLTQARKRLSSKAQRPERSHGPNPDSKTKNNNHNSDKLIRIPIKGSRHHHYHEHHYHRQHHEHTGRTNRLGQDPSTVFFILNVAFKARFRSGVSWLGPEATRRACGVLGAGSPFIPFITRRSAIELGSPSNFSPTPPPPRPPPPPQNSS